MPKNLPRRLIDELITRWSLAGIRQVIVEGPSDERFIRLLQHETHCDQHVVELDICSVDLIEVPVDILETQGIPNTGAKQRVVAFSREIESKGMEPGFRCIVDWDLDRLLMIDFRSNTLIYTDYGCMNAYTWTTEILRRLAIQFKCESSLSTKHKLSTLFSSINKACKDVTAVRLVNARNPELMLNLHNSDKCLSFSDCKVILSLPKYVEQSKPSRGYLAQARELVMQARVEIEPENPLDIMNSHDLLWLLTYSLKKITKGAQRTIDQDVVASSLMAFGLMRQDLTTLPMFVSLSNWSSSETG